MAPFFRNVHFLAKKGAVSGHVYGKFVLRSFHEQSTPPRTPTENRYLTLKVTSLVLTEVCHRMDLLRHDEDSPEYVGAAGICPLHQ